MDCPSVSAPPTLNPLPASHSQCNELNYFCIFCVKLSVVRCAVITASHSLVWLDPRSSCVLRFRVPWSQMLYVLFSVLCPLFQKCGLNSNQRLWECVRHENISGRTIYLYFRVLNWNGNFKPKVIVPSENNLNCQNQILVEACNWECKLLLAVIPHMERCDSCHPAPFSETVCYVRQSAKNYCSCLTFDFL